MQKLKKKKKKWRSKSLVSSIQTIAMHDIFPNVAVLYMYQYTAKPMQKRAQKMKTNIKPYVSI